MIYIYYIYIYVLQQGPHLNDDQFFDAIEETLGKMESLENLSENNVIPYTPDNGAEHRMYKQVFRCTKMYVTKMYWIT